MPAYSYQAINNSGKKLKGIIEADNSKAARTLLRAKELIPLDVKEINSASAAAKQTKFSLNMELSKVFNPAALVVWTQQLASLVAAGLTIERALTSLMEDANKLQLSLMSEIRAEVNAGSSFAKALSKYPREFNETYRAVIEAGEQSGKLDQVLEQLAADLEQQQGLKAKIIGAILYPSIVVCASVIIIVVLMIFVVPTIAEVFTASKQKLPFLTIMVMAISDFLRYYWYIILLSIVALVTLFKLAVRQPKNRIAVDKFYLKLPVFGKLSQGYNAARFSATLAMLASSGVPILKAIRSAAETLNNKAMRQAALDIVVQVREGASVASAINNTKMFPAILAMFARLGEQTGNLPKMLQRVASQISENVQRKSIRLATILEPLLIIFTAIIVLTIVLAVLLPIIQMNQMIK